MANLLSSFWFEIHWTWSMVDSWVWFFRNRTIQFLGKFNFLNVFCILWTYELFELVQFCKWGHGWGLFSLLWMLPFFFRVSKRLWKNLFIVVLNWLICDQIKTIIIETNCILTKILHGRRFTLREYLLIFLTKRGRLHSTISSTSIFV